MFSRGSNSTALQKPGCHWITVAASLGALTPAGIDSFAIPITLRVCVSYVGIITALWRKFVTEKLLILPPLGINHFVPK